MVPTLALCRPVNAEVPMIPLWRGGIWCSKTIVGVCGLDWHDDTNARYDKRSKKRDWPDRFWGLTHHSTSPSRSQDRLRFVFCECVAISVPDLARYGHRGFCKRIAAPPNLGGHALNYFPHSLRADVDAGLNFGGRWQF